MAIVFGILSILASLGMLVCLVMVLIPLFKEKGVLHLILGIICGLYPFIWGWMNAARLNIKNVMLAWSGCLALYLIFYILQMVTAQQ
jgi:hypothetical protein